MKLLSALFEVTAYSAVLFAAVMGFKLAFKSRLSPALHFALWFLVIARLCIPVTVESDFHFFAASKPGGEAELQIPVPEAPKERTTAFTGGEAISDAPSVEAPAPASAAAATGGPCSTVGTPLICPESTRRRKIIASKVRVAATDKERDWRLKI